jgi:RNA polymerase sigma factor (sigma-70 family)
MNELATLQPLLDKPRLTESEENTLGVQAHKGDITARNKLVEHNLKLVVFHARELMGMGVPLQDLVAEGAHGLIIAATKFNPKRGKFSAYASLWIKSKQRRLVQRQAKIVRMPGGNWAIQRRIHSAIEQLQEELGRQPDAAEIAIRTGIAVARVVNFLSSQVTVCSLDQPAEAEEGAPTLQDLLSDARQDGPSEVADANERVHKLTQLLNTMNPREKMVLVRRHGLDGEEPATLADLGKTLGVTKERARQIEKKALRTLRMRWVQNG